MKYDFSAALRNSSMLLDEFTERYTSYVLLDEEALPTKAQQIYAEIFTLFTKEFLKEDLFKLCASLAEEKVAEGIPYVIISNELHSLMQMLMLQVQQTEQSGERILTLFELFTHVNNVVAKVYLNRYVESLISLNSVRRNSLSDLVEKNVIKHYESHLIWLSALAQQIKEERTEVSVELNPCRCAFGEWMQNEAKLVIKNNSKYASIDTIHKNLHLLAQKIVTLIKEGEYHILLNYLEKCELISLSIGTELALIDNVIINTKITKDSLTGALNRQALGTVFQSHYDLALATSNSFILAICDLDNFKSINDTYGHLAGDAVLEAFVRDVKKSLRNSDVIVRYGGEEFVLMLPSITAQKGFEVLDSLRKSFAQICVNFGKEQIGASVSIGMVEIKPVDEHKKEFLDKYLIQADQKLYLAKESGKNRVVL